MTEDQWILLLFKIVIVAALASILLFIVQYTRMAPWWRNEIRSTIIAKDILLVLLLVPTVLTLFFSFSRLTSHIAAWVDIGLFGLLTPTMIWRVIVFRKIHKSRPPVPSSADQE